MTERFHNIDVLSSTLDSYFFNIVRYKLYSLEYFHVVDLSWKNAINLPIKPIIVMINFPLAYRHQSIHYQF